MTTIMILGAGVYQVPAIVKAKEMQLRVVAISYFPNDPGLAIADRGYNISTTDREAVLRIARQEHIDGVMTIASEASAPTVAYVASKLNLAGIRYETARTVANKYLLRKALAADGIEGPKFKQVNDVDGVISFLEEVKTPIVIKPVSASGSRGLAKIVEPSEVVEKFNSCVLTMREKDGIIVEEYIDGIDIGGECLIRESRFVFCEFTNKLLNSHFVPIAHSVPAEIDISIVSRVKDVLRRVVRTLQITDGVIDFDIRLGRDGPRIIEIGGRLGGNCIPTLLEAYTGVDLIKENIKFALGQKNEIRVCYAENVYTVRILGANMTGIAKKIYSPRAIVPTEDTIEEVFDCKVGDKVDILDQGANRLGHIIFKSKTAEQAKRRICKLDSIFVVE
ncbi:MAG: ATP-grasp domain-containing protein [Planctomycetota bacterium]|jgi:biotin carboxylase